jgi:YHS domain-containing protein
MKRIESIGHKHFRERRETGKTAASNEGQLAPPNDGADTMLRNWIIGGAAAVAAVGLPSAYLFFQPEPAVHTAQGNVAVGGYDPVSYFSGRPVRGGAQFTAEHEGAQFRFASAENRDRFVADPARYAPAFGGYCAWAVSRGYTASGDPKVWRVVDGRLYLNYNREVGERWSQDIPANIAAANRNWPTILSS